MNPKDNFEVRGAQAASNNEESLTSITSSADMKRAAVQQLISKYFYQLTDGCGNDECSNKYCASSSHFIYHDKQSSRNELALLAVELCKQKASLCNSKPNKALKVQTQSTESTEASTSSATDVPDSIATPTESKNKEVSVEEKCIPSTSGNKTVEKKEVPYLTEKKLSGIIETCKEVGSWSLLIRTIGEVFNDPQALIASFRRDDKPIITSSDETTDAGSCGTQDETVMTSESDVEKLSIKECTAGDKEKHLSHSTLDMESLRKAYDTLFAIEDNTFQPALINALVYLSWTVQMDIKFGNSYKENPNYINIFLIVMEIPVLHSPEFLDAAFPNFCTAMSCLPMAGKARLARIWSQFEMSRLQEMLDMLQQIITLRVMSDTWNRVHSVNDDAGITGAVSVMKILYYACLYGGEIDSTLLLQEEKELSSSEDQSMYEMLQGAVGREPKELHQPKEDALSKELGLNYLDCRKPLIPYSDFVNQYLNEVIEMDVDFPIYKADMLKFSFMSHPFILTTATKNLGMFCDNRIRMMNERRTSLLQSLVRGGPTMPYLRLRIRRDHVVDDALVGLEMAAMDNPADLKKQLFVEFEGEQGIDEGGVSKEFFQLIVEEIFNPDFGMFTHDEDTHQFWFNPMSFENDAQFTLIGIVLGLAIYNNIILDIKFPMVVYRKLMGKKGVFEDMKDSHPVLAHSLRELLHYDGDVEEDLMVNFVIGHCDVYGSNLTHELREHGAGIPVTNDNRQEYVDMYADYLLNKSIVKQFKAFKRGFQMVTDESPLKILFRPEELELLVCGSKNFDFQALEDSTEYDGGFDVESRTIKNFWEVVHELSEEQKKQLLQFTTGSDRIPVGGLAKLKLIIARNGPDSNRLPTAHTCFNVLLLPDYSTKEKLNERLLKAITHAKGFGML